ncbi:DUF3653 domain-containing protein [Thalassotalea sp. 1_MG-2023]|uniref:DUF3653 domain-containing protein n=1 Tax=Thalassotalea sp. 1_MG-2023 TaxID=3062680 RepID=UPI0034A5D645
MDITPTSKIQIAKNLGVTVRCIEKWIVNDKPNKQAIKLLKQRQITLRKSSCWKGFRFSDDYLITPNGYKIKASELLAFGLYKQMM